MNNDKFRFYYIWDYSHDMYQRHPLGCICMFKDEDGTIYRGVSICSNKDSFQRKIGRNLAMRNAVLLRNKKHGTGTTGIAGYIGSRNLAHALNCLASMHNPVTRKYTGIDIRDGKCYAKASFVGEKKDGGIPMSNLEKTIWEDNRGNFSKGDQTQCFPAGLFTVGDSEK